MGKGTQKAEKMTGVTALVAEAEGMKFEVESHVNAFIAKMNAVADVVLEEWGLFGEGAAVDEIQSAVYSTPPSPNYDRTGNLRDQLTHRVGNVNGIKAAIIGSPTEYAPYVELGTSKMPPRPFIRPAIENNIDEYGQILKENLENA